MRKALIAAVVVEALALAGTSSCIIHQQKTIDREQRATAVAEHRADTTAVTRDTAIARYRRARTQYLGLVGRVAAADTQMNRYANIVARDPSQAVFLRGWTRRAFTGVLFPDTSP